MTDAEYIDAGRVLGLIPAAGTFFASWWYCAATYGYLFGFGLGWIPSLILAGIVYFAVALLWGIILAGLALVLLFSIPSLWDAATTSVSATEPQAEASSAPVAVARQEPNYSKMLDNELLHAIAAQCGSRIIRKCPTKNCEKLRLNAAQIADCQQKLPRLSGIQHTGKKWGRGTTMLTLRPIPPNSNTYRESLEPDPSQLSDEELVWFERQTALRENSE